MERHFVWQELQERLWHTTSIERLGGILKCGAILPEPDIPERERYSTLGGPRWFPYVRSLGGVSLFDFAEFDLKSYSERCPASSWDEFIPIRRGWGHAVWIEIDRTKVQGNFISGVELIGRWKAGGRGRRIMPYIEAAHIGALPADAFLRAFIVREAGSSCEPVVLRGG